MKQNNFEGEYGRTTWNTGALWAAAGDCTEANRVYFRRRRESKSLAPAVTNSLAAAGAFQPSEPGPVETGVEAEIAGLTSAEARPGLAAIAAGA